MKIILAIFLTSLIIILLMIFLNSASFNGAKKEKLEEKQKSLLK